MFVIRRDEELTAKVLHNFICLHLEEVPRYKELMNQYLTNPPILKAPKKEEWKPDDRIPVNFGKYLVDTFNGFFVGKPLRVSHDNEDVNTFIEEFWRYNALDNVLSETSKLTSIYGRGYWYIYQNEFSTTEVAYSDPLDMFIIYSDDIRPKAKYGVRYVSDKESGGFKGQLFTLEQEYLFNVTKDSLEINIPLAEEGTEVGRNLYNRIPIIEVVENDERLSLIQPVERVINTYNRVLSEKSNDVSYFSDAYLKVLGAKLAKEDLKYLKENKIINLAGKNGADVTIDFMSKPNADSTQENMLDRLERLIFQLSMVVNLNDDSLGGSASGDSGVALEHKEQPMSHMALNKERKYTQALQTMFAMVFNVDGNVGFEDVSEYLHIKYNWSRNLPANSGYEADTVKKLDGIVSRRKQLEMLSAVDNVDKELSNIAEELVDKQAEVEEGKKGAIDSDKTTIEEEDNIGISV